ncbi:MAG: hypothetical protein WBG71_14020 [Leeuwenhoekiella sp.]
MNKDTKEGIKTFFWVTTAMQIGFYGYLFLSRNKNTIKEQYKNLKKK